MPLLRNVLAYNTGLQGQYIYFKVRISSYQFFASCKYFHTVFT